MRRLTNSQHAERLRLYREGKSDRQIGKVVGIDRTTIGSWRRAQGLPRNMFLKSNLSAAQAVRRLSLIKMGLSDCEVARKLGINNTTVSQWRKRHGVASTYQGRGVKRDTLNENASCATYSLDALLTGNAPLIERLADSSWSTWLEEMGATVW